jgi:hypothetical protein
MLPRMSMGNWLFWSVLIWIGINFIWLGVLPNLPAWIGAIIATVVAVVTFKFGPRPKDEEE